MAGHHLETDEDPKPELLLASDSIFYSVDPFSFSSHLEYYLIAHTLKGTAHIQQGTGLSSRFQLSFVDFPLPNELRMLRQLLKEVSEGKAVGKRILASEPFSGAIRSTLYLILPKSGKGVYWMGGWNQLPADCKRSQGLHQGNTSGSFCNLTDYIFFKIERQSQTSLQDLALTDILFVRIVMAVLKKLKKNTPSA